MYIKFSLASLSEHFSYLARLLFSLFNIWLLSETMIHPRHSVKHMNMGESLWNCQNRQQLIARFMLYFYENIIGIFLLKTENFHTCIRTNYREKKTFSNSFQDKYP